MRLIFAALLIVSLSTNAASVSFTRNPPVNPVDDWAIYQLNDSKQVVGGPYRFPIDNLNPTIDVDLSVSNLFGAKDRNSAGESGFSEIVVAEVTQDPPTDTPTDSTIPQYGTPEITNITTTDTGITIEFVNNALESPDGGFDVITNGNDPGDLRSSDTTRVIPSGYQYLNDTDNCFQVESRYTQLKPSVFNVSGQKCQSDFTQVELIYKNCAPQPLEIRQGSEVIIYGVKCEIVQ